MPGEFAISPAVPSAASSPATATSTAASAPAQPDPATLAAASKRPLVNPSLHLDPGLNLVVLQFIDDKGNVTDSFPSAKQLKAYRIHQAAPALVPTVDGK